MVDIQLLTFKALLTREGWSKYSRLITEDVITTTIGRSMYASLSAIHELHDADIDLEKLGAYFDGTYSGKIAKELAAYCDRLKGVELDGLAEMAIHNYYVRERANGAAKYILENSGRDGFDAGVPMGYLEAAMEFDIDPLGNVLNLSESGVPGETDDRPNLTSLGLSPSLDTLLGGGVASGELLIILAPPSRGKTSYLCQIGADNAKRGKHVLHITLEIPKMRVCRRYDSCLCHMSGREMMVKPDFVIEQRKQAGDRVNIVDWSDREDASPRDIKETVKLLRKCGQRVDMVIVDYLALMMPNRAKRTSRQEQRHVLGQLGKDLRATGVALNVPMVTAWQVNREGSDIDTIDSKHISECFDMIMHSDIILALNQNNVERQGNRLRIGILKQRDGTVRESVDMYSDLDRCKIERWVDCDVVVNRGGPGVRKNRPGPV